MSDLSAQREDMGKGFHRWRPPPPLPAGSITGTPSSGIVSSGKFAFFVSSIIFLVDSLLLCIIGSAQRPVGGVGMGSAQKPSLLVNKEVNKEVRGLMEGTTVFPKVIYLSLSLFILGP